MKTVVHRVTAWLLACTLALGLAACGDITPKEAQAYIQGELDACYLGQYNQDYLDLLGISAAAAEAQHYVWNTQAEAEFLMDYLDIYPTEASYEQAVDLVRDIYACSKYQVGTASKLEDGSYAVTVTVQPMDIMVRFASQNDPVDFWYAALDRHGIYTQEALDAMSDADYEALEDDYAAGMLEGIRALLPEMGYGPSQSVVLQLQLEDDTYTLVETDWQHLDSMIIDYSGQYCDLSASSGQVGTA